MVAEITYRQLLGGASIPPVSMQPKSKGKTYRKKSDLSKIPLVALQSGLACTRVDEWLRNLKRPAVKAMWDLAENL